MSNGREPEGLDVLRSLVLAALVLDVVATGIGQALGVANLGPGGPVAVLMGLCAVAAATATLGLRPGWAVVASAVLFLLAVVIAPSGTEPWLLVIIPLMVAIHARRRTVGLVTVVLIGYAVVFGARAESRNAGEGVGTSLLVVGLVLFGLGAGLVARQALRARNERRQRIGGLERENLEIRTVERLRLAEELQTIVRGGIATIIELLDPVCGRPESVDDLRRRLDAVAGTSRTLLGDLRALMEMLRQDPDPQGPAGTSRLVTRAERWLGWLTDGRIRTGAALLLTAAAVTVTVVRVPIEPGAAVGGLGLLGCALALWRTPVAVAIALAALTGSVVLDLPSDWTVVPATLLCLTASYRLGQRRVWLVVLLLSAYGVLLAVTDSADPLGHSVAIFLTGLVSIAVGLAARHFVDAHRRSRARHQELVDERDRIRGEESDAVARELHDVVAHQLTLITLAILGSSGSRKPDELAGTLATVQHCTTAAQHELTALLAALRRPVTDRPQLDPLVSPLTLASTLERRLTEGGFGPVMDIDAAADWLDPTSRRTVARVLQEATTNIIRYAPAGSVCRYTLGVDGESVRLTIASSLPATDRSSPLSMGWGLRGLRERVHLTHGAFSAGPSHGRWVLSMSLPVQPTPSTALSVARSAGEQPKARTRRTRPS